MRKVKFTEDKEYTGIVVNELKNVDGDVFYIIYSENYLKHYAVKNKEDD